MSSDYFLPIDLKYGVDSLLCEEEKALRKIVIDVSTEIRDRKSLEAKLLSELMEQEVRLDTHLLHLGIDSSIYKFSDHNQVNEIRRNLDRIAKQRIETQQQTRQDVLELKKIFWHYWLLLRQKEIHRTFLK